ncbi:MAG: carbonic anhydrase family protein [Gammaproteobacteria bacterium]|nr:carbonic anhydrase family protein [Gammaproteobacteria bacterium]
MHKADSTSPAGGHSMSDSEKDAHAAHWGYSGKEGPKHWGDLSPDNVSCKIGKNQSPIDLRDRSAVGTTGLPALDIHYRDVPLKVLNNGHTIQVNYPLGSYIKVGGHRYELLQFHFHTPSEHKKEGFNYPMEVHFVHSDGDGNLAVLGVIFQEGEENSALNTLLKNLPKDIGKEHIHRNAGLNPVRFIPGNTEFYKYSGSLTTPPCSEGVYWMVFKHPVEVSAEQVQRMNELMGENARPTQSLHSRALLKSWADQLQEPALYEFY